MFKFFAATLTCPIKSYLNISNQNILVFCCNLDMPKNAPLQCQTGKTATIRGGDFNISCPLTGAL